jgi:ribosomal protein S18 acetylase RimI-like enzyme
MVDPGARRRGIATALLDAALPICVGRGYQQALLVIPRGSVAGRELSLSRGAVLEHSEHALVLLGPPIHGPADLSNESERTLVLELQGLIVGTMRVTRQRDTAGVYGFAVDPAWQGRGIGRDVLRRVCRELRDQGVRRITLEVAVDNDRALGLYTSLGFKQVTTEDYYALRLS